MKNKKLLFILVPVIIVAVALIAGIVFLSLSGSPEKIFKNSISKVFGMLETTEEQYSTVKGTMNLTANIESDDENVQALNTMLEGANIGLNMEVDTENMLVNETLKVKYDNENLLNASILLQDEKGYVYLPDWLNKYLELPEEYMEYSDLTEYYDKIATLNQDDLMEAIEEELVVAILNQELVQEKTTLVLNGQETKVTASTLSLKNAQVSTFYSELFNNLRENEKFQTALGLYKDEVLATMLEMTQEMGDAEDIEFVFTIYTKGFLNEFVGVSAKSIDSYWEETTGLNVLRHSDGKYEFVAYDEYEGEREDAIKITVDDKKESKDKGTATITIMVDGEEFVLLYSYETKGDQTTFVLSTIIEEVKLTISGNAVENGNNVKGNFIISMQEEAMGKINLNCAYDFTYGVQIQKVNTSNAVLIDELSEEDQTTLITNVQNSTLYQIIEQLGMFDVAGNDFDYTDSEDYYSDYNEPKVSYGGYTVKYSVPAGFEVSEYSSEDLKMYMDEDFNSINVTINWDSVDSYMSDLDESYVLTAEYYENQKISDARTYTVNGKEFKLRTITYNDEYGEYVELYFAYELDDEYCYVVEVECEDGNISMDTIEYFLDIIVLENSETGLFSSVEDVMNIEEDLFSYAEDAMEETYNALEQEEALSNERIHANGVWYDSVNDYINGNPSENQG